MSLLARRRLLTHSGGLPDIYQEVEYLEADGRQYVDTGYVVSWPELKYEMKYLKTSLNGHVFGVDYYGLNPRYMMGQIYNNNLYIGDGMGGVTITTPECVQQTNKIYEGSVTVTGTTVETQQVDLVLNGGSQNFFQKSENRFFRGCPEGCTAYLFAIRERADGTPYYLLHGRIYYLRLYDHTGRKVRDFVPCYRKEDGKPGMYDLVGRTFYTNLGTGEFIKGPEVIA